MGPLAELAEDRAAAEEAWEADSLPRREQSSLRMSRSWRIERREATEEAVVKAVQAVEVAATAAAPTAASVACLEQAA